MNRRELFRHLGALSALVVVPAVSTDEWWEGEAESLPSSVAPNEDVVRILQFYVYGRAERMEDCRYAAAELRRRGETVLKFQLSTYGGAIVWVPPLGGEFVGVDPKEFSVASSDPLIEAVAKFTYRGGYGVLHA